MRAGRPASCSAASSGWILGDGMQVSWKLQLGLFLVPTALYGIAFFGQRFPKSEASAKGLTIGQMLQEVGILGALVACLLVGLFFKEQLGGILAFFTGNTFFHLGHLGLSSPGPLPWCSAADRRPSRPISPSDRCSSSCCS